MTSYFSNDAVQDGLDAMLDKLDVGGAGSLRIYSGTAPADADTALSGNTLLAQLTFTASPGFANATDGTGKATAAANAITADSSADATGTATFVRFYTNGGTCVWQGTVSTSGANLNLVTTSIVATQNVSCSSFTMDLNEAGT
jgi:hypothetical protein